LSSVNIDRNEVIKKRC